MPRSWPAPWRPCVRSPVTASVDGEPYGTDAAKLSAAGIPSIVLGPGSIDQAHAAVEWVDCAQVLQAVEVYHRIMTAGA